VQPEDTQDSEPIVEHNKIEDIDQLANEVITTLEKRDDFRLLQKEVSQQDGYAVISYESGEHVEVLLACFNNNEPIVIPVEKARVDELHFKEIMKQGSNLALTIYRKALSRKYNCDLDSGEVTRTGTFLNGQPISENELLKKKIKFMTDEF
jgi:hypothetical protein